MLVNQKSPCLRNGLTDRHEIWHSDAHWLSEGYRQIKFRTLNIQDGVWPRSCKIEKCSINGRY